jgi:hypothetical protein
MCDYSLTNVKSRPAAVGDKLVTKNFGTGTIGFTDPSTLADERVAVCVLPGTEIAFDDPVAINGYVGTFKQTQHKLARFRQINKDEKLRHHDAIEFPDGEIALLSHLPENQRATVLQLPAQPKNEAEAIEQTRVEYAG